MSLLIRRAAVRDRGAIGELLREAFGASAEAVLVDSLVADGDAVIELVAVAEGAVVGHVLFSRLSLDTGEGSFSAVALAPLAVAAAHRRRGIGALLVETAHAELRFTEALSVVLGDPAYYGRFGYSHALAANYASDYQCEALQALTFADAPPYGRLVYAPAFGAL
ncbi:MAG: N-acetyltransferase [Rhizobiaceae bacterium]|nr:N-acetyltransferase [Rhizobiaceae bacterium]